MVTKGEILSIDFSSNTCKVRLPIFETVTSVGPTTTTAIFSIQPGIFNGYAVGDIVEVGFEDHSPKSAVILGKLYLGAKSESEQTGGSLYGASLKISQNGTASIPLGTELTSSSTALVNTVPPYKSIYALATQVQANTTTLNNLTATSANTYSAVEREIGIWLDKSVIYQRAAELEKDTSGNFELKLNCNIDKLISIKYQAKINGEWQSDTATYKITTDTDQKNILKFEGTTTIEKIIVCLEYTKKT